MNIKKYFHWIFFAIAIAAIIYSFLKPENTSPITAVIGSLYIVMMIVSMYLYPVKRDWWLANKNYILIIANLVLFTPLIISSSIPGIIKISDEDLVKEESVQNCCQVEKEPQNDKNIFWSVYYHFVDPGNQHMSTPVGRGWAALLSVLGIIMFNGLLVSAFVGYVDLRREKWLKGKIVYKRLFNPQYIVIGGNDVVSGIVKQILREPSKVEVCGSKNILKQICDFFIGKPYILIQTSRDVESFRHELFSVLNSEEQERIVIYYGCRTSKEDIEKLNLKKVKEVYIIGEESRTDDIESYHDTMNMRCLRLISNRTNCMPQFNNKKLVCRVMFEYQTSFNLFQATDIDGEKIEFLPFNYYEMWAQNVLVCKDLHDKPENCRYLPLEGLEGIKKTDENFVHLVIVGMSRMGIATAIEAAHLCHFPNFETPKKIRTKITFIDKNAAEEKDFFIGRFKELFKLSHWSYSNVENGELRTEQHTPVGFDYLGGDFIDIEWEFLNGSIENTSIQKYLTDAASNKKAKLTIAICLPENSRAIAAAAYMPDSVYESDSTLQVLVYQRLNDELLYQLKNNKRYKKKLKAFGMAQECYDASLVEMAEEIKTDVNKAYDNFAWGHMKERFNGKGLTEDDYDKISGSIYKKNTDNKTSIKNECDKWMKENFKFETLPSMKELQKDLKNKYTKDKTTETKAETNDKPKSAKMWSNQYNIYSMFSKFRCFGTDISKGFEDSVMEDLGKVEHNRWVVEQLLMRYRPLTYDQQQEAKITDLYSPIANKNKFKEDFAHLDICSNSRLAAIDSNVAELDEALIKVLPGAYIAFLNKNKKQ